MSEKEKAAVRITNQFHDRGGMAYNLNCEGARLTVRVFGRTSPDDPTDWRIEARTNGKIDNFVITGSGASRAAALHEVAGAWARAIEGHPLPSINWKAIEDVLVEVRAL